MKVSGAARLRLPLSWHGMASVRGSIGNRMGTPELTWDRNEAELVNEAFEPELLKLIAVLLRLLAELSCVFAVPMRGEATGFARLGDDVGEFPANSSEVPRGITLEWGTASLPRGPCSMDVVEEYPA